MHLRRFSLWIACAALLGVAGHALADAKTSDATFTVKFRLVDASIMYADGSMISVFDDPELYEFYGVEAPYVTESSVFPPYLVGDGQTTGDIAADIDGQDPEQFGNDNYYFDMTNEFTIVLHASSQVTDPVSYASQVVSAEVQIYFESQGLAFDDEKLVLDFELEYDWQADLDNALPWPGQASAFFEATVTGEYYDDDLNDTVVPLNDMFVDEGWGDLLDDVPSSIHPIPSSPVIVPFSLNVPSTGNGGTIALDLSVITVANNDVPEPASLAVLGLGALAAIRRRRC